MSDEKFLQPPAPHRGWWVGLTLAVLVIAAVAVGRHLWLARPAAAPAIPAAPATNSAPAEAAAAPAAPATSAVPPETAAAPAATAAPPAAAEAAPAAPADRPAALLAAARSAWQADQGQAARDSAREALALATNATVRREAEDLLGVIDTALVFSRRPMAEKVDYTVQPGDTLEKLAKKFGTTKELIRRSNNFTGDVIRVGNRLRVLQGTFTVQVSRSHNELELDLGGKFFKRYAVGTGQYSLTPTGTFHIVSRLAHPPWYRAGGPPIPYGDTNNVLGTHWLALDLEHYGLHGTWDTNTIGRQSSQGCIRLVNSEIEELYILLPEGTAVTIRD